jgi:hypothetical protein
MSYPTVHLRGPNDVPYAASMQETIERLYMSQSDFIEANLPELADDWVEYAETLLLENARLTPEQLRNSAGEILARTAKPIQAFRDHAPAMSL